MRALRFHKARELAVEKVAEPGSPGPGEVLLRPALCGICGTDLHEYTDGPIVTPARPHPLTGAGLPQILGHEFSAVVAETGPGVTHVRAGDLVTIMPLIHCGKCHECLRGQGHRARGVGTLCAGRGSGPGGPARSGDLLAPLPGAVPRRSVPDRGSGSGRGDRPYARTRRGIRRAGFSCRFHGT